MFHNFNLNVLILGASHTEAPIDAVMTLKYAVGLRALFGASEPRCASFESGHRSRLDSSRYELFAESRENHLQITNLRPNWTYTSNTKPRGAMIYLRVGGSAIQALYPWSCQIYFWPDSAISAWRGESDAPLASMCTAWSSLVAQ